MKSRFASALSAILVAGLSLVLSSPVLASPRIVGGGNADTGEYPFMTALLQTGQAPYAGQFGGAALIAPQWVLTAGHCAEGETPASIEVWIGGRNLNNASEGIRVAVEAIYMHPDYTTTLKGSLRNDVALLKLATPVTTITPVPLVSDASQASAGTNARIIGWGTTSEDGPTPSILQKADVPIVALSTANRYYGDLDASNLAAGYSAGGVDTCQGDSGGPLLVADGSGGWKVAGIVSFGDGCARPGAYGIYANVAYLRSWIVNTMNERSVNDDHGDSPLTASLFPLTSPPHGNIESDTDLDYFKINVVTANSILTLGSASETDVQARLLDAKGNVVASDNGSGSGPNFSITTPKLRAGVYYLEVRGHEAGDTGPYNLTASVSVSGKPPEISVREGSTTLNPGDAVDFGSTQPGTITPLDFTLANSGTGALRITKATIGGAAANDFRFHTKVPTSIAAGRSATFRVNFIPTSSSSRTATLTLQTNDPDEGFLVYTLQGSGLPVTSDDHGNSRATATLISKPSSLTAFLTAGDVDFFRINVTTRGSYTFSASGFTDTYGTLYDANGFNLTEDDDSGPGSNFQIRRTLTPGTYYLAVDGYSNSTTGVYTLDVK